MIKKLSNISLYSAFIRGTISYGFANQAVPFLIKLVGYSHLIDNRLCSNCYYFDLNDGLHMILLNILIKEYITIKSNNKLIKII